MRQPPLIAPRSSLPYIVIIPEIGPRSWTNQRRKSSLWQNWRPQLLSVTLTSLKRYLQLETLDIILVNLIFGWNCVWQKIVSPAVSWPLSFIEGPSSRSLLKTALILSSVLISVFWSVFWACHSPLLLSFLNFFLKSYQLDLLVKYWRYLLISQKRSNLKWSSRRKCWIWIIGHTESFDLVVRLYRKHWLH